MQPSKLAKRLLWLAVIVAALGIYMCGLGGAPFVGADEPRYAQVAREMFARGDWVTPTLNGRNWFEKPALTYWSSMLGYVLFGVSEWSARLGAALAGVLTVLLIGWAAGRVETTVGAGLTETGAGDKGNVAYAGSVERDAKGGALDAAVGAGSNAHWLRVACAASLASSAGMIAFTHAVNFDIFVTMTITLALTCFFVAELGLEDRQRRWLMAGFYAGIGASLLAKGLIGIVLPCGVVGLYCILRGRWPGVRRLELWGWLVALLVAATWYAPVLRAHGWGFVDEFIIQHHFARYVSNKYHHPQPFYYYPPVLAAFALPWTAFVIAALLDAARHWRARGADDPVIMLRVFALAWTIVPVAFFSLSGSKLPGYVLPALPGAALLAGERITAYLRGSSSARGMHATGVLLTLLALAGFALAWRTQELNAWCPWLIAVPAAVAGLLAALLAARARGWSVFAVAGGMFISVPLIASCALAPLARRESVRDLLQAAARRGYANAPVYGLHTIERTAEFYAAGRLAYEAQGSDPQNLEGAWEVARAARERGATLLVLVPVEYVYQLSGAIDLNAEVIGNNGAVALVAVKSADASPP